MLPISPVPLKVGVVSFVAPLLPMLPITGATLSLISGASGCAGGWVSRVTEKTPEVGLLLPAASVAVAVRMFNPSLRLRVSGYGPATLWIDLDGSQFYAVIVQGDDGAGFAGAAEGRHTLIGNTAVCQ